MGMTTHEQSVIAVPPKGITRRRFSTSYKRELVEQTFRPDVSMAAVALANGINTNLLARWRRDYLITRDKGHTPALIPIHVVDAAPVASSRLRPVAVAGAAEIEVRLGGTVVIIRGAPDESILGAVLRQLLPSRPGSGK
jgi:transposase